MANAWGAYQRQNGFCARVGSFLIRPPTCRSWTRSWPICRCSRGPARFRQLLAPPPQLGEALLAQVGLLPDAAVGADRVGLGLRGQAAEEDYALLIAVIF